jgi:hypothetical protein
MIKDLIEVKQLPVIEEQLKNVSAVIEERVKNATSLVCTEETVKTIKELRASLNKDFKEFETQRKIVKEQVLKPYNDFENIYKECISDKFKNADLVLKGRIETVENELKAKKEQEVKDYFEEYKKENNIDFIEYGQAKINVTLSASMKSLKEQVKEYIDKVVDDLKLIETQEHKAEILVEYKQTLNVSTAITTVVNRFKAIEEEKIRQEQIVNQKLEQEKENISKDLEVFKNDVQIQQNNNEFKIIPIKKQITIKVSLYDEQIEKLKKFLEISNIEYESEEL